MTNLIGVPGVTSPPAGANPPDMPMFESEQERADFYTVLSALDWASATLSPDIYQELRRALVTLSKPKVVHSWDEYTTQERSFHHQIASRVISFGGSAKRKNSDLFDARLTAGFAYMTDPKLSSIRALSEDPKYRHIGYPTLKRWSREDNWLRKRHDFFKSWHALAAEWMKGELASILFGQLKDMQKLRDDVLAKLRDSSLKPKSWENVARILLDVDKRIVEMAQAIGDGIKPPDAGAMEQTGLTTGRAASMSAKSVILSQDVDDIQETARKLLTPEKPEESGAIEGDDA